MEPEDSLPPSQVPATFSYPDLLYIKNKFVCVSRNIPNLFQSYIWAACLITWFYLHYYSVLPLTHPTKEHVRVQSSVIIVAFFFYRSCLKGAV